MQSLNISETEYTPQINFDSSSQLFEIRGKSYPENTQTFYAPVFNWVEQYLAQPCENTFSLNIELFYFNSSSSKALFNLFDLLEIAAERGKKVVVNWIYEEGDEDNLEFGREFMEDLQELEFNLIKKSI